MQKLLVIFVTLTFVLTVQSQTITSFDEWYQRGLNNSATHNKDSSRFYYKKLNRIYKHPTYLQKAKLHYLKLKSTPRKVATDSTFSKLETRIKRLATTDTLNRAESLMSLGLLYASKEKNNIGIPYLLEAITLFESIGEQQKANHCKINLAESYRIQDQPKNGVAILYEVLKEEQLIGRDRAFAYNRLATLYNNSRTPIDSVIKYSLKCISIAEQNNYYKQLALSQNELGYIYHRKLKQFNTAIPYYKQAIQHFALVEEHRNVINTSINYSNLYIDQKQYQKALKIMNAAFNHVVVDYPSRNTRRMFLQLSKIHRFLRNYKEALEYLDLANLIERLIYFNEVDAKLFEMSAKYDTEIKEKQIINQIEHNNILKQRNRLIWIISIILLSVMAFLLYFINIRNEYLQQKRTLAELENKKLLQALEIKNKKLVISTLHLVHQTTFEKSIIPQLEEISSDYNDKKLNKKLMLIIREIKRNNSLVLWAEFEKSFIEVNTSFYKNLNNKFSHLSKNEKKICAFIKLNMSTKDIASILNITVRGVETARYRLRKTMNLDPDISLNQFLEKF